MLNELRKRYNEEFTDAKYRAFIDTIGKEYDYYPPFRLAETPVFVTDELKAQLLEACEDVNNTICDPDFKSLTRNAIRRPDLEVPGEDYHTRFLQMDFGICKDEYGNLSPQLIEIQGFPSLYFFQDLISKAYHQHFHIDPDYSVHFDGLDSKGYINLLRKIIVGDNDPENVVLLEIEPEKQITRIDFLGAQHHLGIKVLCVSKLKKKGRKLFYIHRDGREVPVYKIYNRVIFDELVKRDDLKREFSFRDDVDVEWVGHPNWFFRISKYTLPLLKSKFVPGSLYLDGLEKYPDELDKYVLKPLYSFAGSGVKLDITPSDLDKITDRENYILQRRVEYAPVIETPNEPVKCEIRMLLLWDPGTHRARIVNNLVRLSKGEMIGVRYNKDKDWVGASVAYFRR